MSLLGKILLVFNLLAGGGFVYLALQDWKGRQNTTAVGLRHVLVLAGLPFEGQDNFDAEDETPFIVEMAGGNSTTTVSKKLLETYFASAGAGTGSLAGNTPVTNQLAEVKRVRGIIEEAIKNAPEKSTVVMSYLLMQAETHEERTAILASAGNEAELLRRLWQKFDAVLKPATRSDVTALAPDPAEKNIETLNTRLKSVGEIRSLSADDGQRRERLAHLLVHLDRDPAWQKRVMMVVGVRRYVAVLGKQALRFVDMAARVKKDIEADDVAFVQQYALLRDQAIKNTQLVNDAAANRRRLEEQLTNDQAFVTQRQTQLKDLETALRKVKADVDELIANQTKIEAVLFAVQREVGLALDEVYKLEDELKAKELERFKP